MDRLDIKHYDVDALGNVTYKGRLMEDIEKAVKRGKNIDGFTTKEIAAIKEVIHWGFRKGLKW
jgi:hypothetical protein